MDQKACALVIRETQGVSRFVSVHSKYGIMYHKRPNLYDKEIGKQQNTPATV